MDLVQVDDILRHDHSGVRLPHDPKYGNGIAFTGGAFCPLAEATIPLLDAP